MIVLHADGALAPQETPFPDQPMPVQIVVGAVALAVLWVLWVVLRVTLAAFRATFRGL
jgi:hypothetical protein